MTVLDRLDPEFVEVVGRLPIYDLSELASARSIRMRRYVPAPESPLVSRMDAWVPVNDAQPDVLVRTFRPVVSDGPLPCLFWIQGGGFVLTAPDLDDKFCEELVIRHCCTVVSVSWRRAPEFPYPAASDDCYAGFAWAMDNASTLGIDSTRVAVGGASSGGGLAAGLALQVRDRHKYVIAHQLLFYPMLDDTNTTPSSFNVTDTSIWNRTKNEIAWRSYLGDAYGSSEVSPYAAPTRMENLSGVAPATILVGELDLFVDEDIVYAQRLIQAGVPTELHVYPAVPHGFDRMVPSAQISKQLVASRDQCLVRAFT
jgi:acetyl esterase/lipase